jgi:hypothetical protein
MTFLTSKYEMVKHNHNIHVFDIKVTHLCGVSVGCVHSLCKEYISTIKFKLLQQNRLKERTFINYYDELVKIKNVHSINC